MKPIVLKTHSRATELGYSFSNVSGSCPRCCGIFPLVMLYFRKLILFFSEYFFEFFLQKFSIFSNKIDDVVTAFRVVVLYPIAFFAFTNYQFFSKIRRTQQKRLKNCSVSLQIEAIRGCRRFKHKISGLF